MKMATTFKEFGIIDIWRELHPATHITLFLIKVIQELTIWLWIKTHLYRVKECEIGEEDIEDEADVSDHCVPKSKIRIPGERITVEVICWIAT